jgi:hypothetical protein
MNCKVVAVILSLIVLALLASITHADCITESNTTMDGTSVALNAGQGEGFYAVSIRAPSPAWTLINL